MKNMKKLIVLVLIAIIAVVPVTSKVNAISTVSGNTLKYYAVILGTSNDEVAKLLNETSALEFEEILENMLESRKYTDDMYNMENNISTENVTLSLSINDCALLFDTDTSEINNHLSICGINVYNKIINAFNNSLEKGINTASSGGGSDSSNYLPTEMWADIYKNAHTGNILITKDSINYNYRHGHIGIIQNHNSAIKYVTDAWQHDDPATEVYCHPLHTESNYSSRTTYWGKRNSLCLTYPNTASVTDRERAGNQTWYYAEGTNYRYEAFNTKATARNNDSRKINCVGLAVRAYYFMASYDIVPDVNSNAMLLPSNVYYSKNIRFKYNKNGDILRTSNFESIEWGF